MNDELWLKDRQAVIAGTDIPRILGCYYDGEEGPSNVYREKTSQVLVANEPNLRMQLGTVLQPFVLEQFATLTGARLSEVPGVTRHQAVPWIGASLDAKTSEGYPVDAKCIFGVPGEAWGDSGTDQVPDKVLLQVLWQMLTVGAPIGFVAALFVGYQVRWYRIEQDPELADLLVLIAGDFHLRVVGRRGVEDWQHPLAEQAIAKAQRVTPGKSIVLPDQCSEFAAEYVRLGETIRNAEEKRSNVRNELIAAMGDAEIGLLPDGSKTKRQTINRKAYLVEATSYVDFRIFQPRKAK